MAFCRSSAAWRSRWEKISNLDFNLGEVDLVDSTAENLGELDFSLPSGFSSQVMMAFPRACLSWYVIL